MDPVPRRPKGRRGHLPRSLGLLLVLAAVLPLRAQEGGWATYLEAWGKARHGAVNLLAPQSWLTMDRRVADGEMLRLTTTGDVWIEPLDGPSLDRLRKARDWSDASHWLLLDRKGQILDEGTSPPTGTDLRDALLAEGIQPTWESLDRFLRLHPDHGTALSLRLNLATRMARIRFRALERQGGADGVKLLASSPWPRLSPARILDPVKAAGWDREVADTLNRLAQLPDAWRLGSDSWFRFWLNAYGSAAGPDLQPGLSELRDALAEAWQRFPDSGSADALPGQGPTLAGNLGELWLACDRALRGDAQDVSDLPSCTPVPGRVWPTAGTIRDLAFQGSTHLDWNQLLTILDRIPVTPPSVDSGRKAWEEWREIQGTLAFWRLMALSELQRWPEAIGVLQDIHRGAGSGWDGLRASLRSLYGKSAQGPGKHAPVEAPPAPPGFLAVLDLPALPDPPLPAPRPPLRFLVWGSPAWMVRWPVLRATGDLATYGPGEWKEEAPNAADTARMRAAGFPAAGWAVFRGAADLLARGDSAPDPARLALQLRAVAPSRIEVLDAFLAQHPDNLDAHRERYDLARARMPLAALEGRMQEDAAVARLPLDFGPEAPWISDLEGWHARAVKVIPPLQAALERWPDNAYLWRAWVSWSAFLPRPPSVLGLATEIPVFGSRAAWAAGLPAEVHRAIARECRQTRHFQDMADWFQGAWAEVQSRNWKYRPDRASMDQEAAIYEGYREALQGLGMGSERTALEHAWSVHEAEYPQAATR